MTVKELNAVFATLPVKLRCFYNDHELDYSLSEYANMEVLDVIDFAIQKERDESIFGNPRIVTYSNTLVLDVLIRDKKESRKPFPCNREKCKGCEQFGWVCDLKRKGHGYFTCRLQNKKCADTYITAEFIIPQHFSESQIVLYDD